MEEIQEILREMPMSQGTWNDLKQAILKALEDKYTEGYEDGHSSGYADGRES